MTSSIANATAAYIGAFVEEMSRAGVRHVCIAPGSRSTPLALTIASHPRIRAWMHLDERSSAFFALGMARALDEPVAILCTSGTAAANFLPAVVEARMACIPLIVLTADRPPELRDVGAAQTIDQNRLYGNYPKLFVEVALAEFTPELLRYVRTLACRAVAASAAVPAGPVHLNFPFREPLVPAPSNPPADMSQSDALAWAGRPNAAPWVIVDDAAPVASSDAIGAVAQLLTAASRPVLICGPQYDSTLPSSLGALAAALAAPLLADPLSQCRWGLHDRTTVIDRYDAALRDDSIADSLAPDIILRIGGLPTSKPLLQYIQRHPAAINIVVDAAHWPDPTLLAARVIHAQPRLVCEQLLASVGKPPASRDSWLRSWRRVQCSAGKSLAQYTDALGEPFEGAALAAVAHLLPSGSTLFVSSSMPVRDLDAFAEGDHRTLRVMANRGANGIDGVVSSALGVAATQTGGDAQLVLVIGDIAFYHDMNGLMAGRLHGLDATIVVLNNDGGGIFSFLPQSTQPDHFEQLFGTPHGLTFESVAKLYGAQYALVSSIDSLRTAVTDGLKSRGLNIIELRTDRARNVLLHRDAWTHVARAITDDAIPEREEHA
ncbi:MAG TPA: 2-succinyl-5-enolpyruvyl-6-hydroxy-3-cyclohexene-1-carboxylic-acid synthase [Gemmatimonadaceae bacterium]